MLCDLPSLLNLLYVKGIKIPTHSGSETVEQLDSFLYKICFSLYVVSMSGLTFSTSTGSLFMLFGQINSGRFSDSPGRSKILSRFFTSSIRSLAAFESSKRSLRTMSLKGSLKDIEDDLGVMVCPDPPSADVRPDRVGVEFVDREDWC